MSYDVIQIDETTCRIEDGFVRMFLLKGRDRTLLIDSGASKTDVKQFAESLVNLPVVLLNTHGDTDHTGSNASFSEFYMHEKDVAECKVKEKYPNCQIHALCDGQLIDLGKRELEILEIPGHTKGSVAILDRQKRVLYSGDSVRDGHIYMFGKHRNPELFLTSLEKLAKRINDFDLIYPSHGTPILVNDYVNQVASSWKKVLNNEISFHEIELHGRMVLSYDDECCGFYCEQKNELNG